MHVLKVAEHGQHATDVTMLHNSGENGSNNLLATAFNRKQREQLGQTAKKAIRHERNRNLRGTSGWSCNDNGLNGEVRLQPPQQQYYSNGGTHYVADYVAATVVEVDEDAALVETMETEICLKPKKWRHQHVASGGQQDHYKIMPTTRQGTKQQNITNEIFISSIISILPCQQQQQQQLKRRGRQPQPHLTTTTSFSSASTPLLSCQLNKCPAKDLINIIRLALITLLLPLYLLHMPQSVVAGCRDEPSRSCEVICRPTSMKPDNDHIYYHAMHQPIVDDTLFNSSTSSSSSLSPAASASASASASSAGYDCTIRALVLLPDNDTYLTSLRRVVPILKVAEEYIHESGLLPSSIKFEWMPRDDKCDAAFAMVNVMDGIVKNCAHVIFGPTCDYSLAAVGRITKYFNSDGTPLITVGGSTYDFEIQKTSCSDEFYMLLRTGMLSFETISELTINVMKRYKWSRSVFFYDKDGQRNVAGLHTCFLMMNSLGKQMRKEKMNFAQYQITRTANRTDEMIREIGNKHSGKPINWTIKTSLTSVQCTVMYEQ